MLGGVGFGMSRGWWFSFLGAWVRPARGLPSGVGAAVPARGRGQGREGRSRRVGAGLKPGGLRFIAGARKAYMGPNR